jgi:hypothetical protein
MQVSGLSGELLSTLFQFFKDNLELFPNLEGKYPKNYMIPKRELFQAVNQKLQEKFETTQKPFKNSQKVTRALRAFLTGYWNIPAEEKNKYGKKQKRHMRDAKISETFRKAKTTSFTTPARKFLSGF